MSKVNLVSEEMLLLERPNLKQEANITTPQEMLDYKMAYSAYNYLLLKFMMKEFFLEQADLELAKHSQDFSKVSFENMDLYQMNSSGLLQYFYLRNNIYIERLKPEERRFLCALYQSGNLELDTAKYNFIKRTYLPTILEQPDNENQLTNYGPSNAKFIKPVNAIIIGVRYDSFAKDSSDYSLDTMMGSNARLRVLTEFLERKVHTVSTIPFYVIPYDEYSVNVKKKEEMTPKKVI